MEKQRQDGLGKVKGEKMLDKQVERYENGNEDEQKKRVTVSKCRFVEKKGNLTQIRADRANARGGSARFLIEWLRAKNVQGQTRPAAQ